MVVKKGESGHTGGGGGKSPGLHPRIRHGPFLQSVSRIWASRRSPRPVFAECFKDLLPQRCTRDLRRPASDECFKDLGLPEISAARLCRVFQGFAASALPRRSPEARKKRFCHQSGRHWSDSDETLPHCSHDFCAPPGAFQVPRGSQSLSTTDPPKNLKTGKHGFENKILAKGWWKIAQFF